MSAWKSRWSWVRFVKSASSKWIASARCSASACEETSITQALSPASSIRRNVACRSIASGVVRSTSSSTPPTTCLHGPQQPALNPGGLEDLPQQERRRRLPVGPRHPNDSQLRRRIPPKPSRQAAPSPPAHRRPPPAPRPNPAPARQPAPRPQPRQPPRANSCPSLFSPGTQKNSVPGPTFRLS